MKDLKILITRPVHQAQPLCDALKKAGAEPILFPTIEIVDPLDNSSLQNALQQLANFDIAIFVSANAVFKTVPLWPKQLPKLTIAAIGPATAKALVAQGLPVTMMAKTQFNSEALLNHPALQQIANKKIVIFSGEGGRNLLEKELSRRGAEVTKANAYRRIKPNINTAQYLSAWQKSGIDMIVSTSNESLRNLLEMVDTKSRHWLLKIRLLVVSQRLRQYAQELGFEKIILAANATDKAILAAIKKWYSNYSQH